jgi:prepilin-type N-terminal cleavage/methylation domain-containing protein
MLNKNKINKINKINKKAMSLIEVMIAVFIFTL